MGTEVQAQEVRTEPLNETQLALLVTDIAHLLQSWGYTSVTVTLGFGCNLPPEQLWRRREIEAKQIAAFVERSAEDGVFQFGRCDLHIEDKQATLEFRICHESDIHFESIDPSQVTKVLELWLQQGMTLYLSAGPKGNALPKEWKRIDPQSA
ncbi:MAG TPA: hypothetical protein VK776_19260 [Bryobacteraceae bacterium]|nr:hypothetical protein [Bryobacteraceae bacterium]